MVPDQFAGEDVPLLYDSDDPGQDCDDLGGDPSEAFSVRWLLVRLLAEYARRNGHADLTRERIDGGIGD